MEIQGAGHVSDYVGQPVSTTGIVTAVDTNGIISRTLWATTIRAPRMRSRFTGAAPAVAVVDALI